jgi:WD40 repeat protein/uncharacterized protein YegL
MRRLPIYILIDRSASMVGEPVEAVKVGLDKLLSSLRRDPFALENVYLSLITFDENADVLVPITELSEFSCPEITLSNNKKRNLGLGLQLLLTRYEKEVKKTTLDEKGDWLPIVVLMTNGNPDDPVRFKNVLPQFKKYPFAKKIVCLTGAKSKTRTLNLLTNDIFVLDIMDSHAFSRFWKWVSTLTGLQNSPSIHSQIILPPVQQKNNTNTTKLFRLIKNIASLKSFPAMLGCLMFVIIFAVFLWGITSFYYSRQQAKIATVQTNFAPKSVPSAAKKISESIQLTVTEKFGIKGVLDMLFSSDGQLVLTISSASSNEPDLVRIWDVVNGKELRQLVGHQGHVWSIAFSPDQKSVLTASEDGTARIWDTETGKELQQLNHKSVKLNSAKFSHDGKLIVTSSNIGIAWIWDAETGQLLHALKGHEEAIRSSEFSPDNEFIITSAGDNTVRIWRVSSGEEVQKLSVSDVHFAGYSPNGQFFVTKDSRINVLVWDAATYEQLYKLKGMQFLWEKSAVVFSTDGQFILTNAQGNLAQLWDITTGKDLHKFQHTTWVYSAEFSPDGRFVITASADKTAKIWDTTTGKNLCTFEPAQNMKIDPFSREPNDSKYVKSAFFSPDGRSIMTFTGTIFRQYSAIIWSLTEKKEN